MVIMKAVTTPLTDEVLAELKAGEEITITGVIYTARDAAHKRMVDALAKGEKLVPLHRGPDRQSALLDPRPLFG